MFFILFLIGYRNEKRPIVSTIDLFYVLNILAINIYIRGHAHNRIIVSATTNMYLLIAYYFSFIVNLNANIESIL